MPSLPVEQVIAQVNDALRAAQADTAQAQLTKLLSRQLTSAQTAHVHALLAHAHELKSEWSDVMRLLRPYEHRARTASLPPSVQQVVCLRLAAWHTEQGEWPKAIHWARQALHLAKLADDPRTQGEAHQSLGKAYRLLGQPAIARQHYQAALNLHQRLGARVLMAWSYLGLGIVATSSSEYALARQSLQRGFNLVGEADDPLLFGLLCGVHASTLILEEVAPLDERVQWMQRTETIFARIGHQRLRARTLGNWGDQLLRVGRWQEGQKLLEQALALGQEVQDRRSMANALESLAELHLMQGNDELAQSILAEALSWVEGHDRFIELQIYFAIARLYGQQGHAAQARAAIAEVVELAAESEARQWQIAAQLYGAEMALEEHEPEVAAELLRACQTPLEQLRNLTLTGQARFVEGRLALAQQDFAAAGESLGQARTMFAASGRCWWFGRANFALAEALAAAGQWPAAHDAMRQATREFQALKASPLLARCQDWLAQHPLVHSADNTPAPVPDAAWRMVPESEGIGRLLRAVPFREVVVRELRGLLQTELPQSYLTFSEPTENGAWRVLLTSAGRRPQGQASLVQLEPWRGTPLRIELVPALRVSPKLGSLLQAAQTALEVCATRERESFAVASEQQAEHLDRQLPGVRYQSQAMRALAARIYQIQGNDIPVLLLGETGTGKELIAQAIHALSDRHDRPFVPFNCAYLAPALVESQLFGYRKGAFTGASQASAGVIRAAKHGTLFLDEIGDLPLDVQPKLLRFLQSKEIHPLGASQPERVNVRLIAATHHSLESLVEQGKFREDLHYRLQVLPLYVPPLRERREEIPLLAQHFLSRFCVEMKKPGAHLAPEALDLLMVYDWPGNVRQLENEVQRLVALLPAGALIRAADLAHRLRPTARPALQSNANSPVARSLTERVAELEKTAISEALAQVGGNITQAAPLLHLTRKGLQLKLKRYGIDVPTTGH
jgi:hydrogenase-4 transcriptional activator